MGFLRFLCLISSLLFTQQWIDYNIYIFKILINVHRFHFWNETVGICQYKHEHLAKWLDGNRTNNNNFISKHYIII